MAIEEDIVDVVIPITSGFSSAVDLSGKTIVEIWMPAAWTAADIVPHSAPSPSGTYLPFYDDTGTAIVFVVAASRAVLIDELIFAHRRFIKFKADGQAAARTIKLRLVALRSLTRKMP